MTTKKTRKDGLWVPMKILEQIGVGEKEKLNVEVKDNTIVIAKSEE